MKKLVTVAIILCVIAGAGLVYVSYSEDRSAPEISFSSEIVYYDDITEEELMEGVMAVDEEEGDVSDSLTIERVVTDGDGAMATVIYAAKDSRNNVAKASRIMEYDVPETEEETEEETEAKTEKETEKETESETEEETEEISAAESAFLTSQSETEEEELSPYAPRITLTQTRVTIQQGDTFEPTDYVDTITDDLDDNYELWRRIQVEGNYDTNITGIYQLVYYVVDTSGYTSNRATLLLIVEGDEDDIEED